MMTEQKLYEAFEDVAKLLPWATKRMTPVAREAALYYLLLQAVEIAGQHDTPTTTAILKALNTIPKLGFAEPAAPRP